MARLGAHHGRDHHTKPLPLAVGGTCGGANLPRSPGMFQISFRSRLPMCKYPQPLARRGEPAVIELSLQIEPKLDAFGNVGLA